VSAGVLGFEISESLGRISVSASLLYRINTIFFAFSVPVYFLFVCEYFVIQFSLSMGRHIWSPTLIWVLGSRWAPRAPVGLPPGRSRAQYGPSDLGRRTRVSGSLPYFTIGNTVSCGALEGI
jgi:hypothetical protein